MIQWLKNTFFCKPSRILFWKHDGITYITYKFKHYRISDEVAIIEYDAHKIRISPEQKLNKLITEIDLELELEKLESK